MEATTTDRRTEVDRSITAWAAKSHPCEKIRAAAASGYDVRMACIQDMADRLKNEIGAEAALVLDSVTAEERLDPSEAALLSLRKTLDYIATTIPLSVFPIQDIMVCRILHQWPEFRQRPAKFTAVFFEVCIDTYDPVCVVLPLERPRARVRK